VIEAVKKSLPDRLSQGLQDAAGKHSKDLAEVLRVLAEDAAGNIDRMRTAIETWFDSGMDRVSGWYKRWTQLWQLGIGLLLAAVLNINIVTIGLTLWHDIPLRSAIVGDAQKVAQSGPSTTFEQTRQQLDEARLPIGWPSGTPFVEEKGRSFDWTRLPGWLLTAIGASFGAPFWFDLLGRFVKLRSGGPRPDEAKTK